MAVKVYKPEYPGLYYFDTFTFTTLGTSGHRGPDSTKGYTDAPWRDGDFSIVDGQQQWTVPATGTYRIEAAGAYGATPGRVVSGDLNLSEGQTLTMLVGQQPTPLTANVADNVTVGGGGGTFVVSGGTPLMVASGGDGGAYVDNPWSQPVIVPTQTLYSGYINTLNDTGNVLATIDASNVISVFTYDGFIWSFQTSFPGILLNYSIVGIYGIKLNDTGDKFVHYSPSEIRVYNFNSFWDYDYELIPDSDLDIPGVYVYNCAFSGDGKTVVVGTNNTKLKVFKYTTIWTLDTTIIPPYDLTFVTNVVTSGVGILCDINYNGDRFATTVNYNKILVYDYPWTDPPFVIEQEDRLFGMSNDGNRIISINFNPTSLSNVYTYPWTNPPVSIDGSGLMSKDGQTILVPYLSPSSLRVYDTYPWNDYKLINPEPDSSPYWGLSIVPNYDGSVILISDPLNSWIGIYYKAFFSRSGGFSPFGNGLGDSGAGYLGDGSVSDPYFGFFKPKAYVNGGFGNSYEYGQSGVPKGGGFGGGQSPLGKNTGITIISSSVPPLTIASLYSYGHCLNRYATWCFLFTSSDICIYNFNGTTWDLIASLSEEVNGVYIYPSMSDDGSKVVYLNQTSVFGNRPELYDVKIFQDPWSTPQIIQTEQHGAKISGDGQWVVYSGPSGTYKYNISSDTHTKISDIVGIVVDTSNDGSMIALGSYNYVLLYPSLKEISYEGTPTIVTVSLSGDGTTLFVGKPETTAGNGPLYIYKDEFLQQTINQVADDFYRYTDYTGTKTCGVASGEVYVLLSGTYVKQQTVLNDLANHPFRQTHSMASNGLSISCSPGTNFLNVYAVSNCHVTTTTNHGYPYDYRVIISSTNFYNATWDIVTTSSNTFTFQAFGGPTETTGYVSGTTTGISGGGGYTGSAGDGVSGATCYADESVANFTDLGATSNHMGYVTVSLIDPAPIDLTLWSWDDESPWDNLDSFQANVYTITWSESLGIFVTGGFTAGVCTSSNDAKKWYNHVIPWPYSSSPLVAADDKPILVLGRNTSSDGITWYLNDLPYTIYSYADVTNTVYVNKMFISTAAPDYYTPYTGIYTSTDGYAWTFISSELISVKAYGSSMYVGTTNAQSNPNIAEQVVYSTDLVTWNYTSIYVYDLIFANGIFIGFNGDGSVISSDGISWTLYPYVFAISYSYYPPPVRQVVFGNDLFMVVTARHVYTSPDGMNWTLTKIFSQNIDANISVTYSPSKQFFMFAPNAGVPVATLEGKYFTSLSEQIKYPVKGCAYSKGLNVLVVIARSYSYSDDPIYIYTSSDNGETLLETSILYFGYQQPLQFEISILWSDEFYSFFIYFATSNNGLLIFTSSDGMTWTRQNDYVPDIPNYNLQGFNPVWYKEKNLFEYKYQYSSDTFYSPDGINWSHRPTTEPSPPEYIGSKVWSPDLELFVGTTELNGISSSFDVYVSTDGINWSTVYTAFMSTVGFVGVVWSPELKKFYIYAAGYPTEADSLYLFSSENGYDWNRRVVPNVYTLDYARGFYWFSGFDRFVVQSFENFKGITFSSKAIKQF